MHIVIMNDEALALLHQIQEQATRMGYDRTEVDAITEQSFELTQEQADHLLLSMNDK